MGFFFWFCTRICKIAHSTRLSEKQQIRSSWRPTFALSEASNSSPVTAAASEQCFDVPIHRFYYAHGDFNPAVVENSLALRREYNVARNDRILQIPDVEVPPSVAGCGTSHFDEARSRDP